MRYLRCSECGMVFADIDAAAYSEARHNAWDEHELSEDTLDFYERARAAAHVSFLDLVGPAAGRSLLDVGCGLGVFLQRAAGAGWDVAGTDTSSAWVARARERLGPDRIHLGKLEPDVFAARGFDVITLWDVIEHIHEPVELLRSLRARLAPGGRLFIRTPNFAYVFPVYGLRRHVIGHDVELGPLNHVVYFTVSTMRRALDEAGLRPAQWPVLPPPQVPLDRESRREDAPSVRLKNTWATAADRLSRMTRGRLALGSDLDVFAESKP